MRCIRAQWSLLGSALLGLAACASEPSAYGITGPFPDGVAPVTLVRPGPRAELTDDTPVIRADAVDRYAPSSQLRSAPVINRYYGYSR